MKIIFPEMSNNSIVQEAIKHFPDIEFFGADSLSIAATMLQEGQADSLISGIDFPSRDVVLAVKDQIPLKSKYFSSCFICERVESDGKTTHLAIADGGINKQPDADKLYCIVEDTAKTYEAIASTMVEPVPEIRVNSIERVYHKWNLNLAGLDRANTYLLDSAMRVSITLHDIDPSVPNYYNMYADCTLRSYTIYLFSSDDLLFSDPQLTTAWGNWPARFSSMFDDHLFNGKDYTFTILVPEVKFKNEPILHLQVDALSQPLYYFWKAYERYRIAFDDPMANPVRIPSNVEGGWGNVGAVSSTRTLTYGFWHVGHQ